MTASSDYSSSEDEAELSRLQSVAVSGQAVAAGAAAAPSHKKVLIFLHTHALLRDANGAPLHAAIAFASFI